MSRPGGSRAGWAARAGRADRAAEPGPVNLKLSRTRTRAESESRVPSLGVRRGRRAKQRVTVGSRSPGVLRRPRRGCCAGGASAAPGVLSAAPGVLRPTAQSERDASFFLRALIY